MQSGLHPAGYVAAEIGELTLLVSLAAALILLAVLGLLALALVRGSRRPRENVWVVGGGIVFPAVVLSALLLYGTAKTRALTVPPPPEALPIEVVGKLWWWEVRYPDSAGGEAIIAANEIHVPVGRPVDLLLSSADVIHAFWVPSLAGKADMIPGRVTRLVFRADREGLYRGQCSEYCGLQHAHMGLFVFAMRPDAFAAWRAREAAPARPPDTPLLQAGLEAFLAQGCGGCHTIRGEPALGRLGPDLTHVGSRRSLGAATLDNHASALARFISASQAIKPGNLMRSFPLDQPILQAIAAYLESLK